MEKYESNLIFFGYNPFIRMLDAFIDNTGSDYPKKEIQELAGISKGALFKHWNKLEKMNLVKKTRSFGNTTLYTLNTGNDTVKILLKLEMHLIEETAPKEKEKIKAVVRGKTK
ncbi:MAG: winged helix-turn-helix domain-containing protein [archaeon]